MEKDEIYSAELIRWVNEEVDLPYMEKSGVNEVGLKRVNQKLWIYLKQM
ncbi:hypothetical protein [Halalkalibacillus sediminis]|nr:hypothetical protein [Halalkalibacillus sediminis]